MKREYTMDDFHAEMRRRSTAQGQAPKPPQNVKHEPTITHDRTRIGCTCGWHAPPGTDSDDAFAAHAAHAAVLR